MSSGKHGKPGAAPRLGRCKGAELAEFALLLPLLLLLVLAVWDFGSAFLLKDRMTNAAREGARVSISTPLNSANCGTNGTVPCSLVASTNAVKQYLTQTGHDFSCVLPEAPSTFAPPARSTYTCENGTVLQIDRGAFIVTATGQIPVTRVTLTYPIEWRLLGRLLSGVLPRVVTTAVTMQNLT